jgi:hypothetical protein
MNRKWIAVLLLLLALGALQVFAARLARGLA